MTIPGRAFIRLALAGPSVGLGRAFVQRAPAGPIYVGPGPLSYDESRTASQSVSPSEALRLRAPARPS